jgi:hypothetical protein
MNWDRAKPQKPTEDEFDALLEREASKFLALADRQFGNRDAGKPNPTKPWLSEVGGAQLEAFLGSRGLKTGRIGTSGELVALAAKLYELPASTSVKEMAASIAGLGPKERRRRSGRNLSDVKVAMGQATAMRAEPAKPRNRSCNVDMDLLLHRIVMAVINAGHAVCLSEVPELVEYLGGCLPTVEEVIGSGAEIAGIDGSITLTDRVYRFVCARGATETRRC